MLLTFWVVSEKGRKDINFSFLETYGMLCTCGIGNIGSRGVHPPREKFLKLGKAVAGEMAGAERQLAYGEFCMCSVRY